jgi:cyclopropane fatty-acyl-phospholipid synthase-like methyltransferase
VKGLFRRALDAQGTPRRIPMSSPADSETRYVDGTYLREHTDWHEGDASWKAEQVRSMITRHHLSPSTVCDVGCGTGGVLASLAQHLPASTRLVGYEPSAAALSLASPVRSRRIEFRNADARSCSDNFDLVLMLDVFEHIEDYLGFLRILRSSGSQFIFHIPLDLSVQTVLRMSPILRARSATGHLHYFSAETALATLQDCGYRVLDLRFTRGSIELSRSEMRTRLASLPRKLAFAVHPPFAARILGGFSLLVLAEPET